MKKILIRLGAGIVALSLAFSQTVFALQSPEEEESVTKDESVFVILNSDGSVKEQIVSNWLHSDDGVRGVEDVSNIQNIKNIKSDTQPQINGDKITWNSDEKDIYYQGTTNQQIPISASITYKLDGKEIAPENLAGKSGQIEIHIALKNNLAGQKKIDGEARTVAPLFASAIVVNLPANNFTNIKAENGVILSESVNQMVAFVGMPGLKESFAGILDEELGDLKNKLNDEFVITAQTENFELPPIMIGAAKIDDSLLGDTSLKADMDELEDGLNDLRNAADEILDGTIKLSDACVEFDDKMGEFQDKYVEFDNGINDALNGAIQLRDGAGQLKDGVTELNDGIVQLNTKVSQMTGVISADKIAAIQQLMGLLDSISISDEDLQTLQNLPNMIAAIPDQMANGIMDTLKNYTIQPGQVVDSGTAQKMLNSYQFALVQQVVEGAKSQTEQAVQQQLSNILPKLQKMLSAYQQLKETLVQLGDPEQILALLNSLPQALTQLQEGVAKLNEGSQQLLNGTTQLYDGTGDLQEGLQKLDEASDEISDAIGQFKDATVELKDKTKELSDGVKEFKEDGIDKLYEKLMDLTKNVGNAIDISDQVQELSEDFGSYTGAPEGAKTDTKFLMRTPQIKSEIKEDESIQKPAEQQKEGFWNRIKNLFNFGK